MKEKKEEGKNPVISRCDKRLKLCIDADSKNRAKAIEALRFKDGEQWPEQIQKERDDDGRPCLVMNRIPAFVRQVVNEIRQVRPSMKVRGIDDQSDPETANILMGIIRAIEKDCNAEAAYDNAVEYAVMMGWGNWEISTDYVDDTSFLQKIVIKRNINPFSIMLDPGATEPDKSDAKYGFSDLDNWMDIEEFEEKYPNATGGWNDMPMGLSLSDWYQKESVKVFKYWEIDETEYDIYQLADGSVVTEKPKDYVNTRKAKSKKVTCYKMSGGEILESYDWAGKYIPLVETYGDEINIEGEIRRNGMIKDMMDPQRQYNYWRSASTEKVALSPKAPYVGFKGQFKSPQWRNANRKNYPYLEATFLEDMPDLPLPQRQPPPDVPSGMISEIGMAADELKAVAGMRDYYDNTTGPRPMERSGIAIRENRVEGNISNFHYTDNLSRAIRHTGRILVDLIPKIYDTARMIQIIDGDKKDQRVMINAPYVNEKKQNVFYQLNKGTYDVIVDIGPSYATQRQEAAQAMLEFVEGDPQLKMLLGDLIAKNMDWQDADQVMERLQLMLPPGVLARENPQVQAIIGQTQQQMQAMQQYVSQLEDMIKEKDLLLENKQGDLELKQQEQQRKIEETLDSMAQGWEQIRQGWAKLELGANYPPVDIQGKGISSDQVRSM